MNVKIKAAMAMVFCFIFSHPVLSQRYLSDYDSTLFIRDTVRTFIRRMENLSFSGYIQPQFQIAEKEGAPSYEGGNFSEFSKYRFMLRRARVKIDYILPAKGKSLPKALFTFQVDVTERGSIIRDMFLKVYGLKSHNLSLTMGMFARPFGYEVNLSSGVRESPERGRMSQILMPGERDLGAMVSFESQQNKKNPLKFDVGVFNGQGPTGITDFDNYKDLTSRLTIKPVPLSAGFLISGGLSFFYGGWREATKYRYKMSDKNGASFFDVDSSTSNIGREAPRHYYGADMQLVYKHAWGKTEGRAEYWRGKQPGTSATTTSPTTMPVLPTYLRNFDGAFFYFLQNLGNDKNELIVKYDWYDPNTKVSSSDIGKAGTNLTPADIKFSTLGIGLTHYFSSNLKVLAYYDMVRNEKTALAGYTGDIKDNIFTFRFQIKF